MIPARKRGRRRSRSSRDRGAASAPRLDLAADPSGGRCRTAPNRARPSTPRAPRMHRPGPPRRESSPRGSSVRASTARSGEGPLRPGGSPRSGRRAAGIAAARLRRARCCPRGARLPRPPWCARRPRRPRRACRPDSPRRFPHLPHGPHARRRPPRRRATPRTGPEGSRSVVYGDRSRWTYYRAFLR